MYYAPAAWFFRPTGRRKCGEAKFPKSPHDPLIRHKPTGLRGRKCCQMPDCYTGGKQQQPSAYSPAVLIYDWELKRKEAEDCEDGVEPLCTRCADLKAAAVTHWASDAILRDTCSGRTFKKTVGPRDRIKIDCQHAQQLKTWYDQDFNDTARRSLRERLYDPRDGVTREDLPWAAPEQWSRRMRITDHRRPSKIVECTSTNYGLLDRKQRDWDRDRKWLMTMPTPNSVYRDEFAAGLQPRLSAGLNAEPSRPARYPMGPKVLPSGENANCFVCSPSKMLPCCRPVGPVS